MPRFLTTQEVADLLRTSPETIRYWRSLGRGPASFKTGRRVLYDADAVTEWIDREKARAVVAAGDGA